MTYPAATQAYLSAEIEDLEPFGFLAISPSGRPLHLLEVTRLEEGELEVRVPGRPPALPALEPRVCAALREREFANEDPTDSNRPWTRGVADADAALKLVYELLVSVFHDKPDCSLDTHHGSHRVEHEAQQKLDVARGRIEKIVTEILGQPPEQDEALDYVLPIGEVHVNVAPRATPDGQIIVRVVAVTNVGIEVTPELGLFLARLNFGLMFGRFALDAPHRSIWVDETLLGEQFREEELRTAIHVVASTADEWDDRLKQMFGGATYQEVIAGRTVGELPTTKPGEGGGFYL
ncbi:MAG: hypothetical protein QF570_19150 [Myxococcota bacterium]|nr:hypothetical protein [Myxococcota bacterium]